MLTNFNTFSWCYTHHSLLLWTLKSSTSVRWHPLLWSILRWCFLFPFPPLLPLALLIYMQLFCVYSTMIFACMFSLFIGLQLHSASDFIIHACYDAFCMLNTNYFLIPRIYFGPLLGLLFFSLLRMTCSWPEMPSLLIPCYAALPCVLSLQFLKGSAVLPDLYFPKQYHGVRRKYFCTE